MIWYDNYDDDDDDDITKNRWFWVNLMNVERTLASDCQLSDHDSPYIAIFWSDHRHLLLLLNLKADSHFIIHILRRVEDWIIYHTCMTCIL